MATIAPQQIHYAKNSHKEIKPSTASPDQLLAHISNNVSVIVECPREARCHAERRLPKLSNFIHQVYTKCCLTPTLLVVALIYLRRLQRRLRSGSQGEYDTPYKLFLASVILASKFLEDSNSVARRIYKFVAPVYSPQDLTIMERSFLGVIRYDLFVRLDEVCQFVQEHSESLSILELDL